MQLEEVRIAMRKEHPISLIRWAGGMASATSSTIDVGTLVLDMYDPATKHLVWTGNATKTIDPSSNQEKNKKHLDQAMQKLLKHYPPQE